MGTSQSFSGPGKSPLLPPWADDTAPPIPQDGGNPNGQPSTPTPAPPVPEINIRALSNARSNFGRYASGRGGSISQTYREYVRSHRGAQNAAHSTRAGRSSTTALGGFLSGVAQRGVEQTLRDFGLSHVVGHPPRDVVSAILNTISPLGNTTDEAIARQAELNTLRELYSKFELDGGIENLNRMTESDVKDILVLSVTNHIFQRFVHLVEKGLQDGNVSPEQAVKAESDARQYIREKVWVDFGDRDLLRMDWKSPEAANTIEQIFTQAHIILEEVQ